MLVDILGKSLIRRTYENALLSSALDTLVVATDDKQIFDHVKSFGGEVVMTSHAETGSDRAAEVVKKYFPDASTVVVIQGDEPCLDSSVITTLVNDLLNNEKACMTTPVEPLLDAEDIKRPGVVKCVFDHQKKALYFSRSPIPFVFYPEESEPTDITYRHLGVYCFRKDVLLKYVDLPQSRLQRMENLEQLKLLEHGFSIYVSIVAPQGNIGVDYPEDVKKVELFLCRENISSSQVVSSLL